VPFNKYILSTNGVIIVRSEVKQKTAHDKNETYHGDKIDYDDNNC
jgi:pSer/pThr/pTyr-binding forkhead associated (FHA) protein